jgi:hypothetical protein
MDWLRLLPLAFVGGGLFFAVLGVRYLRRDTTFRRRGVAAQADITDVRWEWRGEPGEGSSRIAFAVLRFVLPDGRTVETQANFGMTWSPGKVGDRVDILYDARDPTRARLARGITGAAPTIMGVGMIVFGVLFAVFGAGFFFLVDALNLPAH